MDVPDGRALKLFMACPKLRKGQAFYYNLFADDPYSGSLLTDAKRIFAAILHAGYLHKKAPAK